MGKPVSGFADSKPANKTPRPSAPPRTRLDLTGDVVLTEAHLKKILKACTSCLSSQLQDGKLDALSVKAAIFGTLPNETKEADIERVLDAFSRAWKGLEGAFYIEKDITKDEIIRHFAERFSRYFKKSLSVPSVEQPPPSMPPPTLVQARALPVEAWRISAFSECKLGTVSDALTLIDREDAELDNPDSFIAFNAAEYDMKAERVEIVEIWAFSETELKDEKIKQALQKHYNSHINKKKSVRADSGRRGELQKSLEEELKAHGISFDNFVRYNISANLCADWLLQECQEFLSGNPLRSYEGFFIKLGMDWRKWKWPTAVQIHQPVAPESYIYRPLLPEDLKAMGVPIPAFRLNHSLAAERVSSTGEKKLVGLLLIRPDAERMTTETFLVERLHICNGGDKVVGNKLIAEFIKRHQSGAVAYYIYPQDLSGRPNRTQYSMGKVSILLHQRGIRFSSLLRAYGCTLDRLLEQNGYTQAEINAWKAAYPADVQKALPEDFLQFCGIAIEGLAIEIPLPVVAKKPEPFLVASIPDLSMMQDLVVSDILIREYGFQEFDRLKRFSRVLLQNNEVRALLPVEIPTTDSTLLMHCIYIHGLTPQEKQEAIIWLLEDFIDKQKGQHVTVVKGFPEQYLGMLKAKGMLQAPTAQIFLKEEKIQKDAEVRPTKVVGYEAITEAQRKGVWDKVSFALTRNKSPFLSEAMLQDSLFAIRENTVVGYFYRVRGIINGPSPIVEFFNEDDEVLRALVIASGKDVCVKETCPGREALISMIMAVERSKPPEERRSRCNITVQQSKTFIEEPTMLQASPSFTQQEDIYGSFKKAQKRAIREMQPGSTSIMLTESIKPDTEKKQLYTMKDLLNLCPGNMTGEEKLPAVMRAITTLGIPSVNDILEANGATSVGSTVSLEEALKEQKLDIDYIFIPLTLCQRDALSIEIMKNISDSGNNPFRLLSPKLVPAPKSMLERMREADLTVYQLFAINIPVESELFFALYTSLGQEEEPGSLERFLTERGIDPTNWNFSIRNVVKVLP